LKKKILICCFPGDYSGVPIYTKGIVNSLSEIADFSILTSKNDGVFDKVSAKVVIESNLKNSLNPIHAFLNLARFLKIIRQEEPDIIHLNGSMFGMIGRFSSLFVSRKFVFTYHGIPWGDGRPFLYNLLIKLIETCLLNISNIITIGISKMDISRLQKINFFKREFAYIPNAINFDKAQTIDDQDQKYFQSIGTKKILCVARFSPQKNYRRLFEAFNLLLGSYELTIVGSRTDSDDCKSLARSICSKSKYALINFEGESTDVLSHLKTATVFCLSSDYEGMPLSAIEALASGTPVVMPEVGGAAEFESCGGAMVYRPNTATELSKVIEKLCTDNDLLTRMSRAGALGYKTIFSRGNFSKRMVSVYGLDQKK
jgi:glycosyltransferase involved in cell wall biosynthesis